MRRYFVTSAQMKAGVHGDFYKGIESYCKDNDAELIILPMRGRTHDEEGFHTRIDSDSLEYGVRWLSRKLHIAQFKVLPQQIDPVTGLARFTHYDKSTIFASPKQRMKVIPNEGQHPKLLMTTGACTRPRYREDQRIGRIAKKDHIYGGIVVEVDEDQTFHLRNVQATNRGAFVDLGQMYLRKHHGPASLDALVFGDWHVGDTDEQVEKANYEMIDNLNPRRIILHDFFNGHSVNHHEWGQSITEAYQHKEGRHLLEEELEICAGELNNVAERMDGREVILVASNHDDFIMKYLQRGKFVNDPHNAHIGAKLYLAALEGHSPLEFGLRHVRDLPRNIRFLGRDEEFKVRGWQLGAHGDKGPNGSRRGTMRSHEFAYGKSITGHRHSPEILRNTFVVGTSTKLRLNYTVGPSSWMHTHGLLYDTGKVQMVNVIDGRWRGADEQNIE